MILNKQDQYASYQIIYDEFTDLTWYAHSTNVFGHVLFPSNLKVSKNGQCLILSSRDGYFTLIVFGEILPAYHTQQQTLQLQSKAHHHSLPISYPTNS